MSTTSEDVSKLFHVISLQENLVQGLHRHFLQNKSKQVLLDTNDFFLTVHKNLAF